MAAPQFCGAAKWCLSVNQIVLDHLLCLVADGVHVADPGQGVAGFEGFGHALSGGQLRDQGGHLVPGRLVDVQQVLGEGAGEDQGGEGAVVLLFQVALAHAAILAQGTRRRGVQDQVGKLDAAHGGVGAAELFIIGCHGQALRRWPCPAGRRGPGSGAPAERGGAGWRSCGG